MNIQIWISEISSTWIPSHLRGCVNWMHTASSVSAENNFHSYQNTTFRATQKVLALYGILLSCYAFAYTAIWKMTALSSGNHKLKREIATWKGSNINFKFKRKHIKSEIKIFLHIYDRQWKIDEINVNIKSRACVIAGRSLSFLYLHK